MTEGVFFLNAADAFSGWGFLMGANFLLLFSLILQTNHIHK